jgi:hypothetical protein
MTAQCLKDGFCHALCSRLCFDNTLVMDLSQATVSGNHRWNAQEVRFGDWQPEAFITRSQHDHAGALNKVLVLGLFHKTREETAVGYAQMSRSFPQAIAVVPDSAENDELNGSPVLVRKQRDSIENKFRTFIRKMPERRNNSSPTDSAGRDHIPVPHIIPPVLDHDATGARNDPLSLRVRFRGNTDDGTGVTNRKFP